MFVVVNLTFLICLIICNLINYVKNEKAKVTEFPSAVAIIDEYYDQSCGGVLLEKSIVLTTASCFNEAKYVLKQETFQKENGKILSNLIGIKKTFSSPFYTVADEWEKQDIGFLILDGEYVANGKDIQYASFDGPRTNYSETVTIVGWGDVKSIRATEIWSLRKSSQNISKDNEYCKTTWAVKMLNEKTRIMCTDPNNANVGACAGDGGSPVFSSTNPNQLVGLVADPYKEGVCEQSRSSLITRISSYRLWIQTKIAEYKT